MPAYKFSGRRSPPNPRRWGGNIQGSYGDPLTSDDRQFLPVSVSGLYELHPEEEEWDDWNVPVRGRRRSQPGEWIEDSTMTMMFELGADSSLRPAFFATHPIEDAPCVAAELRRNERAAAKVAREAELRRKAAERARKRRQSKTVGPNRYNCHRDDVPCPYCNSNQTTPWDRKTDPDWTCLNCGSSFKVRVVTKLEVAQ